jgi:hypothetical protein
MLKLFLYCVLGLFCSTTFGFSKQYHLSQIQHSLDHECVGSDKLNFRDLPQHDGLRLRSNLETELTSKVTGLHLVGKYNPTQKTLFLVHGAKPLLPFQEGGGTPADLMWVVNWFESSTNIFVFGYDAHDDLDETAAHFKSEFQRAVRIFNIKQPNVVAFSFGSQVVNTAIWSDNITFKTTNVIFLSYTPGVAGAEQAERVRWIGENIVRTKMFSVIDPVGRIQQTRGSVEGLAQSAAHVRSRYIINGMGDMFLPNVESSSTSLQLYQNLKDDPHYMELCPRSTMPHGETGFSIVSFKLIDLILNN